MPDHFAGHCAAIEAGQIFFYCRGVRPRSRQQWCFTFRSV